MQKLLLLALLFLAFARLKCVEECEGPEVALKINQTETAHIDNRGAEAVVLAPGANGFLSAYGFRLSTFVEVQNQADTAGVSARILFCRRLPPIAGFLPLPVWAIIRRAQTCQTCSVLPTAAALHCATRLPLMQRLLYQESGVSTRLLISTFCWCSRP